MRYTLSRAQAFFWVAKLGSFRAAAAHLNLTQPMVSLRVRELERSLGAELLDRSLCRPVITPVGVAIYADSERMLAIAEQIQRRARNTPSEQRLLRIGAADSRRTSVSMSSMQEPFALARSVEKRQLRK